MEKWKSWAIGIGAGWVLLAFLSWHYETSCGSIFGLSCRKLYWSNFRGFFLLRWIEPYQQILSGLLALLGGAFVLVAGREQIKNLNDSKRMERLNQALDSLYAVGTPVSEYFSAVSREDLSQAPNPIELPDSTLIRDLTYISPTLAQHFVRLQNLTVEFFERDNITKQQLNNRQKIMIARSYCLFQLFKQIGKYARDNSSFSPRLSLDEQAFDAADVKRVAKKFELTIRHLGPFSKFFSID